MLKAAATPTATIVNRKIINATDAETRDQIRNKPIPAEKVISDVKKEDKGFVPSGLITKEQMPPFIRLMPYLTKSRLGMENLKEGFVRLPGAIYRWAPTKRGNVYLTGLERVDPKFVQELQVSVGRKLDNEYYAEMEYGFDGSNPNGHQMNLNNAKNILCYFAMLESSLIAATKSEKFNGTKQFADYFIENPEAEHELKNQIRDKMQMALGKHREFSAQKNRNIAAILQLRVLGIRAEVASGLLFDELTNIKNKLYDKFLTRFLEITEWSDTRINTFAEVQDAVDLGILRKGPNGEIYFGDVTLGFDIKQAQNKLMSTEMNHIRVSLQARLDQRR